jgi:hypothetical protein
LVQDVQDCDFGVKLCNQDTLYRTKLLHSVGWSQGNSYGIYDGQSGTEMGFFMRTSVVPCQLVFPSMLDMFFYSHVTDAI